MLRWTLIAMLIALNSLSGCSFARYETHYTKIGSSKWTSGEAAFEFCKSKSRTAGYEAQAAAYEALVETKGEELETRCTSRESGSNSVTTDCVTRDRSSQLSTLEKFMLMDVENAERASFFAECVADSGWRSEQVCVENCGDE